MFKSRKNISIIAIALIVIIGSVYVGCSKTTDIQTTPETNGKSLSVASNEGEPFVIPIIIRKEYYDDFFVENFKKLPSEMYFISAILAGYKNGEIWFNNEHRGKELINNLESISTSYTLSEKKNYTGIINKLEGLVNRIPLTSNEITTKVIEAIISLTIEILQLEKDTQFIAPDYLNTWEDVENFFYSAHTQSIIIFVIIAAAVLLIGCGSRNYIINEHAWTNNMACDCITTKYGGDKEAAYKGYKDEVIAAGGTIMWDIGKNRLPVTN